MRWGFLQEGFVAQLALGGGQAFFVFGDVFGVAVAFGGDVDLLFVDQRNFGKTYVPPI